MALRSPTFVLRNLSFRSPKYHHLLVQTGKHSPHYVVHHVPVLIVVPITTVVHVNMHVYINIVSSCRESSKTAGIWNNTPLLREMTASQQSKFYETECIFLLVHYNTVDGFL